MSHWSPRNETLTVMPAPLDDGRLADGIGAADVTVLIKVGRHLPRLRRLLERLGLLDRAVYVERATMEREKVLPLAEAGDDVAPYFSMILIRRAGDDWLGGGR